MITLIAFLFIYYCCLCKGCLKLVSFRKIVDRNALFQHLTSMDSFAISMIPELLSNINSIAVMISLQFLKLNIFGVICDLWIPVVFLSNTLIIFMNLPSL